MKTYDVMIIGSGTAGQTAAYLLREEKCSVAVAEKSDFPGGTCALHGCQAKKWFYEAAELVAKSHHLKGKGIVRQAVCDWGQLRDQKNLFTQGIPSGTVEGLKKAGIDYYKGDAHFIDTSTLDVGDEKISAKFFIIASGAMPMTLPMAGAEHMIRSDEFLNLKALPKRIAFIGGGFISFEFAHFAARLQNQKGELTIFEVGDRPLGPFDSEMVRLISEATVSEGIHIESGIIIEQIEKTGSGFNLNTKDHRSFEVDLVVNGAGRVSNIQGMGLKIAGVATERGGISVDGGMKTSNARIYAVGDCSATIQLARVADHESYVAANNILHELSKRKEKKSIDYNAVPAVLFTYPQFGMVGKTEDALKKSGITYQKSMGTHLTWPSYKRVGMKYAGFKVLVSMDGKILGAHIISDQAAGLINTFKQAMLDGKNVEALYWDNIMSPYPSRESDIIYMLSNFFND